MALNVKITNELKNPTEVGTHYRLLCMTGPNKGKVYYLAGKRILIGRGEKVDIQIVDTKISREHAELSQAEGTYTITDLGAQNGVIVNDKKVKQAKLKDGEKIVIGQTVFKYNIFIITESVEMALAEANPDSQLAKDIKKGIKVKIPTRAGKESDFKPEASRTTTKENKGSRMIIVVIIVCSVLYVLFNDDKPASAKSRKVMSVNDDADAFNESVVAKKQVLDEESQKKLNAFIHSGRREFREGNYFRAMEEFRLALLISPSNGQASFYLSKAKQRLDDEINKNFEKGAQEQDAKKFQAAIVSFCGVIQLIKEYPNDDRYKNAMLKLSSIESALGMEKGEIKCFEEKSADSRN